MVVVVVVAALRAGFDDASGGGCSGMVGILLAAVSDKKNPTGRVKGGVVVGLVCRDDKAEGGGEAPRKAAVGGVPTGGSVDRMLLDSGLLRHCCCCF